MVRLGTSIVFAWMEERGFGNLEFLFLRVEVGSNAESRQLKMGVSVTGSLVSNAESS